MTKSVSRRSLLEAYGSRSFRDGGATAESSHLQPQTGSKEGALEWQEFFGLSKPVPPHAIVLLTRQHLLILPKIGPPTGDQEFKCIRMWVISHSNLSYMKTLMDTHSPNQRERERDSERQRQTQREMNPPVFSGERTLLNEALASTHTPPPVPHKPGIIEPTCVLALRRWRQGDQKIKVTLG